MPKNMKNKGINGITLIALVITIIVLLLLAGISISMISGDNSILKQASNAKSLTEEKQEKESISLAYNSVITDKAGKGESTGASITANEFDKAIKNYDANASATADGRKIIVTFSNGHKYTVYSNGNVTEYSTTPYAKDELVVTVSGENVDSPYYVNYPSAKGTIKCRVLYNDSTYGLQIVSVNPVTRVILGKNDPNENVLGEMGSLERAQNSYNRLVTTLNEKAEEYITTEDGKTIATDARCVGSNPTNKNYPDNLTGNAKISAMFTANEDFSYMETYNGKYFKTDFNYETDFNRLKKISAVNIPDTSIDSYYWCGSHFLLSDSNATIFGMKYIDASGMMKNSSIWGVKYDNNVTSVSPTCGFRPVFILSPNVKITGGQGTEEIPFEIGL